MKDKLSDLKALRINVNDVLHREIKTRASFKGISMKRWILSAILEKIKTEEKV